MVPRRANEREAASVDSLERSAGSKAGRFPRRRPGHCVDVEPGFRRQRFDRCDVCGVVSSLDRLARRRACLSHGKSLQQRSDPLAPFRMPAGRMELGERWM
jgi:hypothetical protein